MAGTISPIYDAEAEALKRQMAFANALRDKGMSGNIGQGYQGGRVYIVGNPLSNILSSIGGAVLGSRAEEGQRNLEQRMGQERQNWLNAMPSSTTERTVELEGPTETGDPLTGTESVLKSAKQRAMENQAWAMQAPRGMEGVQQFALQQALTAPQREEEARQKAEDRKAELAAKYAEMSAMQQDRLTQQFENQKILKQMGLDNAMALKAMSGGGGGGSKPDMRIITTTDENGNPIQQAVDMNALKPGETFGKYVASRGAVGAGADGGKPLSAPQEKAALELGNNYATLQNLQGTFKDEYAGGPGKVLQRAAGGLTGGLASKETQSMTRWWADQAMFDELPARNALFGATLTPNEQRAWSNAAISPNLAPNVIRERLATRSKIYEAAATRMRASAVAGGKSGAQFDAATGLTAPVPAAPVPAAPAAPADNGGFKVLSVR